MRDNPPAPAPRCPICGDEHSPDVHSRAERRAAGQRTVRRTGQVFLRNTADGVTQISAEQHLAETAAADPAAPVRELEHQADEHHEPCYSCPCCTSWSVALEQLRTAVTNHEFARTVGGSCDKATCLVCQSIDGTW